MHSTSQSRLKRGAEQGYILLMLMLFITVLAIAAAAVAPSIAFQVRRDREEELIHRGVQYSRAVRRYVKKFGRYPMRVEELENTNNMRFLRKRYKDPVTGQDFKVLHLGEVQLAFGGGISRGADIGWSRSGTWGASAILPCQRYHKCLPRNRKHLGPESKRCCAEPAGRGGQHAAARFKLTSAGEFG